MSRFAKISVVVGTVVLTLVLVAVLVVAGLGSESSEGDAGERPQQLQGGSQPPSGVAQEDLEAFRACLADHGVELPEGSGQAGPPAGLDPTDPKNQEAFSSCRDKLPEGAGPPAGVQPF